MSEPAHNTLVAGRITGCYGIKGWVKIHSFTDPVENLYEFGEWKLRRRGAEEPVVFDACRRHGKGLVAHIKGVDDRNLAETFKGVEVIVAADKLPSLDAEEFYWHQLQGLQVWCRDRDASEGDRVLLGTVDYLIETGSNDVLVVKHCEGSVDKQERLIPYLIDEVVLAVDIDEQRIEVDWYLEP